MRTTKQTVIELEEQDEVVVKGPHGSRVVIKESHGELEGTFESVGVELLMYDANLEEVTTEVRELDFLTRMTGPSEMMWNEFCWHIGKHYAPGEEWSELGRLLGLEE